MLQGVKRAKNHKNMLKKEVVITSNNEVFLL